ncbi:MAG: hypothetical protein KKD77_24475, partial [Gammaproteobacteria bacterium]|nr:hypothetical protein [Gammaproteobacteria bacterium]
TDNLYVDGTPIVITSTTTIKAIGIKKTYFSWTSYFDNTKWVPYLTYGTWDGIKWNSVTDFGEAAIALLPIGTPPAPLKIRVTYTPSSSAYRIVCDAFSAGVIVDPYLSLVEVDCYYLTYGIEVSPSYLNMFNNVPQDFSITNIEFYMES